MKYHPISMLEKKEMDIFIEEIVNHVFEDFLDGKQLTLGEMTACVIKTIDIVLTKQLR